MTRRWWRWFLRGHGCDHAQVRCVHGDEVNHAHGRRAACLKCGTYLKQPLPEICTMTGLPHNQYEETTA